MTTSLAQDIRDIADDIESAKVSTTKWRPVADLLAEELGLDPEDVYVATISKPGNLSVRMDQSPRSRAATLFAGMYTGDPGELPACVSSAVKRCQPGRQILLFVDHGSGMALAAIVKPAADPVPTALAAAYPAASVIDC